MFVGAIQVRTRFLVNNHANKLIINPYGNQKMISIYIDSLDI